MLSSPYLDISAYVSAITFDQKNVDLYWSRLSINPSSVLKENNELLQTLRSCIKEKDNFLKKAHEIIQINPVGILTECVSEYCSNSRIKYPYARQQQEEQIIDLVESISDNTKPCETFVYSSVQPGGFFQDMVLLNRIWKETNVLSKRSIGLQIIGHYEYFNYDFNTIDSNQDRRIYMLMYKLKMQAFLSFICQATGIKFEYVHFYSDINTYLQDIHSSDKRPWVTLAIDWVDDYVTEKMAKDILKVCAHAPSFPLGKGFCSTGQDYYVTQMIFDSVQTLSHTPQSETRTLNVKKTDKIIQIVFGTCFGIGIAIGCWIAHKIKN